MAPAHSHAHYEETVYGIDGVLTWTVDGKLIDVVPGQALCIPRGAVHRFDNNGTEDVKGLCQEDEKSSCCTKDEGRSFGAAL
jgi:quercetin dioxygenase-like cupin family protein